MGPKPIAIVLVLLVGAVAAYDMKFLMNRSAKKVPKPLTATETAASDAVSETAQPEQQAAPAAEGAQPTADEPQAKGEACPVAGAQAAEKTEPEFKLPPVFEQAWTNPFQEGRKPAVVRDDGPAPQSVAHDGADPFGALAPSVSAVLIAESSRRAVIDRLIMAEGDLLPGSGAEIKSITPSGVELMLDGRTRFFRMCGAPRDTEN